MTSASSFVKSATEARVAPAMKANAIVLTSGLSGSSVLTGLLCRAGLWKGESTHKKPQYDTYENEELIALNSKLFKAAGYAGNYMMEYSEAALQRLSVLHGEIDLRPYREFVQKCEHYRPWIWKDPRLWLTIRFWKNLLPLPACRFILLTRDATQTWISQTLRRQITTYRYSKNYEDCIQRSALRFFQENAVPYLTVRYEDLIVHPGETITRLNAHLGTDLGVEDLKKVYRKPLHKSPRSSWVKHLQAVAIYLRNYSQRLDLARGTGSAEGYNG